LRLHINLSELGKGISHLSANISKLNSYLKAFSLAAS
jgi:hypothetical protein